MTDHEQRIAIAEACGWEPDSHFGEPVHWHKGLGYARTREELPDYLNDPNAIQSECRAKFRTDAEQSLFAVTLMEVVGLDPDSPTDGVEMFRYATATARQWCKAFLRTIGKWRNG